MSEATAVETVSDTILGGHLGIVEAALTHLRKAGVKKHLTCCDVLTTGAVMKRTEVRVGVRTVYIVETTWSETGATSKGWKP